LTPLVEADALRLIEGLKPKRSVGVDNISTQFIKHIKTAIAKPLCILINKSFSEGIFPSLLKKSKVLPIFKKKDRQCMDNYRPIALLPVFSKIFEKAFASRLLAFLNSHGVLYESQYGFRRNRSTINAVCELYLNAINAKLKNESFLAVFIDFSKAFDTIDHRILTKKLLQYGIRGTSLKWLESYLAPRSITVSLNGCSSKMARLSHFGVPQGSILGPLLFIVYANDLPRCLSHSQAILYADDTTIFISGKDVTDLSRLMNLDLLNLHHWCHANSLAINVSKTKFMLLSANSRTQHNDPNLSIGGKQIECVSDFCFLGIVIDDKLSWKAHLAQLRSKLSRGLYMLRRVRSLTSKKGLLSLYYSLIHSHLSYGSLLWGSASSSTLKPILTQQKKAIRIVHNAPYNVHTEPLFCCSNILPVKDLVLFETAKFMFLHSNAVLPRNISVILNSHVHAHQYNTRSYLLYRPPRSVSSATANSLLTEGLRVWSSLPPQIASSPSFHAFKRKLKLHLLQPQTT
jgi:hypothetical protein